MAENDFDLATLADYLRLQTQQVAKMANRGQIPGRRIGGEWRFSRGDIHHWIEERIGASDPTELVAVEGALEHARQVMDENLTICDLLTPETIAIPLNARTRGSVISEMVERAAATGWLWDSEKMLEAVRQRESLHPTALDSGVALLHPRRPLTSVLAQTFLVLGRTHQGIPFGHPRGTLTDVFFLICSADDRIHLRLLARLSRLIAQPETLTAIRGAENARELLDELRQFEGQTWSSGVE